MEFIHSIYNLFWGDLFTISLPGGSSIGISLLVLILIPAGIFFTLKTRFLPIRCFPEMLRISTEKQTQGKGGALSGMQALIVSTATRVGMGNMVGVVAAVSAAGAVFWMWITALIGSSTAYVEATLAQIYKESDPLYGGYRGGPAYYIHKFFSRGNVAYLFGDNWLSQNIYKITALVMLFIGGLAAYEFVWDLGDIGIALMTVFNMMAILPMSGEAIKSLKDYYASRK